MHLFRDRIAPALFDFCTRRLEKEFGPQRRALLADARGRVLEVGAGTGWNLAHYPPEVEEIVLTEPVRAMLRRAERRAAELGRPVRAVQASAENLPFDDDSFDTVVSTLVLCTVENQERAVGEIARVLRPGGSLLFIEHVRAEDPRLARWQDRLERPWGVVSMGCHPNRATRERIEAGGLAIEAIEAGDLPKSPPLVRPMISGRAVSP